MDGISKVYRILIVKTVYLVAAPITIKGAHPIAKAAVVAVRTPVSIPKIENLEQTKQSIN